MKILNNKGKWLESYNDTKYNCIRENILKTFGDIKFYEEEHRYFINEKELIPVSNVVHRFQEHFNSEEKAVETYERNFNNPSSKYYRMTSDEILKLWKNISDDACEHGTGIHAFGESCFYYMIGQYDKILPEFLDRVTENGFVANEPKEEALLDFYNEIPKNYIPILAETRVYNEKFGYAGTFDILFYYDDKKNPDKSGLMIFDFKTNKDLYKNFKEKKLLNPFYELLDMPLSLYKLQLSLYQIPLEDMGYKIVGRRLIWAKPDATYEKIPLETYGDVLRKIL